MHFVACWVANSYGGFGWIERCGHKHQTIGEASDCISLDGIFLRAVESFGERSISDEELATLRDHLKGLDSQN